MSDKVNNNLHIVFLSLGSNLGDRKAYLDSAAKALSVETGVITAISPIYETEPWGFETDNKFYNQVIKLETGLGYRDLLDKVHEIEKYSGRERTGVGYSSRTLDIDILFYDDLVINEPGLIIPHTLLHERRFVLQPMSDIAPDFIHPLLNKSVKEMLDECRDEEINIRKVH